MILNKTKTSTHAVTSLPELIDETLGQFYPSLFVSLNELTTALNLLTKESGDHELLSMVQKIFSELDTMYRKEKFVVFPYIKKCYTENKKMETCAPIKNLKLHVSTILGLLQIIKQLLPDPNKQSHYEGLVNNFESKLISLQKEKEKYIFEPVRSCVGCKVVH
ncbi:MAG: hypothetical protein QM737_09490 [Ferruginibacter sp.]